MKFLCVHGVGHQELSTGWQAEWSGTIAAAIKRWSPQMETEFEFLAYDDLFEAAKFDQAEVGEALLRLAASGIWHGIGDLFGGRTRDMVARGEMGQTIRWTGGMVAQWVADEKLRAQCSDRISDHVGKYKPDVLVAHSLGSLITYDALLLDGSLAKGRRLVTLGSQVGNAAVRQTFAGHLAVPTGLDRWYHLYNPFDRVFTARVPLHADSLVEIDVDFNDDGPLNHSATEYLGHGMASDGVWQSIAAEPKRRSLEQRFDRALASARRTPTRRALLVGINDYPNPEDRLEGCVNDVFEVSATLQELGFDASEIRVVVNDRATAANIKDRLHWLLDDTEKDDVRFFFYSGHGAPLPGYGAKGEVDAVDECLVPYDFAWTPDTAIVDDWFNELYSQLDYDVRFYVALDCCHAGGMTRNGARRAKGLEPPDDIRHRLLRWNSTEKMWVERELPMAQLKLTSNQADKRKYTGESGAVKRLGSAVSLWSEVPKFNKAKERYGNFGPYTPVMLYACKEKQLSYEYRHGVQSYGAFTYCLTQLLRNQGTANKTIDFEAAIEVVKDKLATLGYDQEPNVVGPEIRLRENMFSLLGGKVPGPA